MKQEKEKTSILQKIFLIIKIICIIFLLLLIVVVALQRFSNNKIAIGGFRIFNVATESMVPKYLVGDILVIKETNIDNLKVGDDVTYMGKVQSFEGRIVTHQIVQIDETENGKVFHTKGIANETEDPTITGDQIFGKVVYKSKVIGLFSRLMTNMTAFYIIIFIPLGLLIFLQIKDSFVKSNDDDDDDDEEEDEEDDDE